MKQAFLRLAPAVIIIAATSPAFAEDAKIDAADTAWMIGATGLVLMMTIPGLALFYAGMVRKKNVLATMAQTLAATFLVSILWAFAGYSLAFTGEGAFIGSLDRIFLNGVTLDAISPLAKTIPESLFMIYQMTFAVITVPSNELVGQIHDRMPAILKPESYERWLEPDPHDLLITYPSEPMTMWPVCFIAQPKTGMRVSSFLATQRSWNSSSAATAASTS